MNKIYFGSSGVDDWKARLADPLKHWKEGRSAFELASAWEAAAGNSDGLPTEIRGVLDQYPELKGSELLMALPEHAVALEGKGFDSYNDLWALLGNSQGLISLAVEAKAGESFDKRVGQWLDAATNERSFANRKVRLEGLFRALGVAVDVDSLGADSLGADSSEVGLEPIKKLRYQLLHRTASALLEAKRFQAKQAVVIVQDFSRQRVGFTDFQEFGRFLGLDVLEGQLSQSRTVDGIGLRLGWVSCHPTTASAPIER